MQPPQFRISLIGSTHFPSQNASVPEQSCPPPLPPSPPVPLLALLELLTVTAPPPLAPEPPAPKGPPSCMPHLSRLHAPANTTNPNAARWMLWKIEWRFMALPPSMIHKLFQEEP